MKHLIVTVTDEKAVSHASGSIWGNHATQIHATAREFNGVSGKDLGTATRVIVPDDRAAETVRKIAWGATSSHGLVERPHEHAHVQAEWLREVADQIERDEAEKDWDPTCRRCEP